MSEKRVISVIGSGGKTSYIAAEAEKLQKAGKRVLVVTTTHMRMPEAYRTTGMPALEQAKQLLLQNGLLYYGMQEAETGKMIFPEPAEFAQLLRLADVVFAEADGSRGLPAKLPDLTREPVLLPQTTEVVLVQGLSALHKPVCSVCHRWKGKDGIVDKEWMAELLSGSYLPWLEAQAPGMRLTLVWNQADTKALCAEGRWLAGHFGNLLRAKNKWNLQLENAILCVYGRELTD